MKVKIENFGPVKDFEFDSDLPIHLIVGTNNIGKSYALTAYYIAVSALLESRRDMAEIFSELEFFAEKLEFDQGFEKGYSEALRADENARIDVKGYFLSVAKKVLEYTLVEVFNEKIISSYFDFKSILNQEQPGVECRITLSMGSATLVIVNKGDGFSVCSFDYEYGIVSLPQALKPKKKNGIFYTSRKVGEPENRWLAILRQTSVGHIMAAVYMPTSVISGIYYLPASRSGLYQALSSFGPIIAELTKRRSLFKSKIELPGISGQLSDYYLKLTEINESIQSDNSDSFYDEITNKIEREILDGVIAFDEVTKKLFYTPNGTSLKLELSNTSSMVSELGPVVAYLRYILSRPPALDKKFDKYFNHKNVKTNMGEPKHLLIIEEPEAHLHPENQIKITGIYAELAAQNVNVILTSHSNYIFGKLSNLILSKVVSPTSVRCDFFERKNQFTNSFSLEVNDFGIDDQNFLDASESLVNERMELLSNMDFSNDQ